MEDINSCLKNYCQQTHLDSIDNSNILGEHLGNRKHHLNKHGNSVLANNFIKYLRSSFSILDDFSRVRNFQAEHGSHEQLASGINRFTNNVSDESLQVI